MKRKTGRVLALATMGALLLGAWAWNSAPPTALPSGARSPPPRSRPPPFLLPAGTTFLATDHTFTGVGVADDDEILAASDAELVRVPKARGLPTVIARFEKPGRPVRIRAIALASGSVIAQVMDLQIEQDVDCVPEPDRLRFFRNAEDASVVVDRLLSHDEALASTRGSAWIVHPPSAIDLLEGPAFTPRRVFTGRLGGFAADRRGAVWLERTGPEYRAELDTLELDGSSGRRIATMEDVEDVVDVALDASNVYVVTAPWDTNVDGRTALHRGIHAIDRTSGDETTLALDVVVHGAIAVGSGSVFVTTPDSGSALAPTASVLSIPKNGGPPRQLASGLLDAHCLTVDDRSVYVVSPSFGGIAVMPAR